MYAAFALHALECTCVQYLISDGSTGRDEW